MGKRPSKPLAPDDLESSAMATTKWLPVSGWLHFTGTKVDLSVRGSTREYDLEIHLERVLNVELSKLAFRGTWCIEITATLEPDEANTVLGYCNDNPNMVATSFECQFKDSVDTTHVYSGKYVGRAEISAYSYEGAYRIKFEVLEGEFIGRGY